MRAGATGRSGGLIARRGSISRGAAVALGAGVVLTVDVAVAVGIALSRFALARINGSMSVLICPAAALGTGRARAALRSARSVARAEGDHLFGCAGLAQSRWIGGMYIRDCRDRAGLPAGR